MSEEILKKVFNNICSEELEALKPGNLNSFSGLHSMSKLKFKYAAKISSEYLISKNLSLGEGIYLSVKKCKTSLNSNYNLGIILLCAPLLKLSLMKKESLKSQLKKLLTRISKKDGDLIIKSISHIKPAGLQNYSGNGNVLQSSQSLGFTKVMRIGSDWDRISRCYIQNYNEIFEFGLPFFRSLSQKIPRLRAIELLFLNYLARDNDSHIQRKFGAYKAKMISKKSLFIQKSINYFKNNDAKLKKFDRYLKKFHYNPGTCADLTVTTLLMDKIRDIFKIPL
ncbi:MAG: triphosphoribosyl-dephospho-CoA synthase [Alphaproteobacteria bacterium]